VARARRGGAVAAVRVADVQAVAVVAPPPPFHACACACGGGVLVRSTSSSGVAAEALRRWLRGPVLLRRRHRLGKEGGCALVEC
jgi:hypothetical protein